MSSKVQYNNVACFYLVQNCVFLTIQVHDQYLDYLLDRIFQQEKRENAEETGSLEDKYQDTVLRTCL
jgi:hypothetical protein